MKKTILALLVCVGLNTGASLLRAADAAPAKPSIEDRLADLEAYVTNGARQTNAPTALATSPGPGHNGFQMVSAALVLFMTLPGLALFYGGLVRRKNVLSVLAQCL
ncbi:MAG TPA: ammonia channel protein, partial [Candidatus Binatia bacterium]|nr:ammonia channel protein [Candidatus Binatia bacterium]